MFRDEKRGFRVCLQFVVWVADGQLGANCEQRVGRCNAPCACVQPCSYKIPGVKFRYRGVGVRIAYLAVSVRCSVWGLGCRIYGLGFGI